MLQKKSSWFKIQDSLFHFEYYIFINDNKYSDNYYITDEKYNKDYYNKDNMYYNKCFSN
jgi:hypothetical protein